MKSFGRNYRENSGSTQDAKETSWFLKKRFLTPVVFIYEDCAWISKQTGIERPQYIGYHFTPGGNVQRFLLVKKEGVHGFHWWAGPLVPVAYYKMHEENLVITVLDIQEVIVHQMTYRRT